MKKNYKIKLICFFGVLGILLSNCKKSEPVAEKGLTANNKNLAIAGDDKWDLLGYGYDMTGELFSLKNASQGAIIDVDRFNLENPGRINTPTTGSGSDFVYSGATAYDYVKDVNRQHNFGISGSAGNSSPADPNKLYATANISSNNSTQNTFTYNSKYSYATYESVKNVKSIIFHDASIDLLKNYLTPLFLGNLSNLTPENLVKTYGTHVLLGITIGGRLRYHFNGSVVKETTAERKLRAIKAGFSLGISKIFGINLSADISNEEKTTIANETAEKSYSGQYFGGSNGGASFTTDAQGNASQSVNLASWQQSVNATNAALTDIISSVPIYEFITDPNKKQQVKSAVDKYIADRQVSMINDYTSELVNINAFTANGGGHHYLTTGTVDDFNYWRYESVAFRAFDHQVPGTVPINVFYSQKGTDHYYTTGMVSDLSWWSNQGVAFYAFKTQVTGTVPVYEHYSSKGIEHYFTTARDVGYPNWWTNFNGVAFYAYPAQ